LEKIKLDSALFVAAITNAYLLLNTLRAFSNIPQIVTASKEKSDARAVSLSTWSFSTSANLVTGMYATFVVKDIPLSLMSYGNTLGSGLVVAIVLYKRIKYSEKRIAERNKGVNSPAIEGASCESTTG
jgi:cell division protein FtsW (lipid II flippase)